MVSANGESPLVMPDGEFTGFPHGVRATPVPDPLLGALLERIDDLAELKVSLRALWLAAQKKGALPTVSQAEFLHDRALVEGLGRMGSSPQDAILRGLDAAVRRRTLLAFQDASGDKKADGIFYAVNTEANRQAVARREAQSSQPAAPVPTAIEDDPRYQPSGKERPNIYTLYENNIGSMTPMIAEQLKEAEGLYPASWVREGFQIAVNQNKRSWPYVAAILKRWANEGKNNGKPRRNSPKDNREKYIEAYRRRRGDLPGGPGAV
jgi:DnaD/phage-associated family protein